MPKKNRKIAGRKKLKPLAQQLADDKLRKFAKVKRNGSKMELDKKSKKLVAKSLRKGVDVDSSGFEKQDQRMEEKIVNLANQQMMEIEKEEESNVLNRTTISDDDESDLDVSESEDEYQYATKEFGKDLEISEQDQASMDYFMNSKAQEFSLGDIIAKKMKEREEQRALQSETKSSLNPKVIEVYQTVGMLMSRFRSGKVPKALKIISQLKNWDEILDVAGVESFSPQAMFVLTRSFSSNAGEKTAQRFYHDFLVPRIRDDIFENKKLNYHLYNAVKKTLFKPAAFFKGIIVPMILDETTTTREAIILASVLQTRSVPMLHSAAAMIKITQVMSVHNFGPGLIFLKVLLNKKYSLPLKVIEALVQYFDKFKEVTLTQEQHALPVVWHQCLLTFVQRYKLELTSQQRNVIKNVIKIHEHRHITAEIRRELSIAGNANAARTL